MLKKEFYFPSSDGQTQIHVIQWFPEAGVKAVLQISHGMVEYIDVMMNSQDIWQSVDSV